MAQALGYVSQSKDGNFEGTLGLISSGGNKSRISIVANDNKTKDKQPDFRVFTSDGAEVGGGWNRVGKTSGKPYISLTLAHPMIGPRKVYANLGRANGKPKGDFAILWNPAG